MQNYFFLVIAASLTLCRVGWTVDSELASKLKKDLEFDNDRRGNYEADKKNKRVFNGEREKGLSLFLEEQEKWDGLRERGRVAQEADRSRNKQMDETGPEYAQDQKEKRLFKDRLELARKLHVETKSDVKKQYGHRVKLTEEKELGLETDRPRFDLRKRGANKWVSNSGAAGGRSGSAGGPGSYGGGSVPPAPSYGNDGNVPFDYPVPMNPEYQPMPNEGFDDIPPPPPMMPYDGYGNPGANPYNGGDEFGAPAMGYPPPPPPEGGWDF